jgi:hypothetical protein
MSSRPPTIATSNLSFSGTDVAALSPSLSLRPSRLASSLAVPPTYSASLDRAGHGRWTATMISTRLALGHSSARPFLARAATMPPSEIGAPCAPLAPIHPRLHSPPPLETLTRPRPRSAPPMPPPLHPRPRPPARAAPVRDQRRWTWMVSRASFNTNRSSVRGATTTPGLMSVDHHLDSMTTASICAP